MPTKPSAQIPSSLPPAFTYSEAVAAGLSAERRYRDEGRLEQHGRDLYRRANASPADHNLLEISHRVPEGTLCLIAALAHQGLTDAIPDRIDIAIPRGRCIPALQSPANVHVFAKDAFGLGRGVAEVGGGLNFGLSSAERSLVDMVPLRHRERAEVTWETLRRWLRREGARPAALIEKARSFRGAESAVRHALEIVL